ncbi:MAG TPA: hypothetical protein PK413_17180 [Thermoanaerobaculia bacterium]|nr:hypothetical protein [Thermoanaerobaculia bacterium]
MRRISCCFALALLLRTASLPAAELPGVPYVENAEFRVSLLSLVRSGPGLGDFTFTFVAENRQSHETRQLVLANETTTLERLEVIGSRLAVLGKVGDLADIVTLYDLAQGKRLDSFLCYAPSLSPDGRTLVAHAFYPRFAPAASQSSVVEIYALEAAGEKSGPTAVYPRENLESGATEAWVENEIDRHSVLISAGWLWSEDGRRVVFVDRHAGASWLVSLELGAAPRIAQQRIDASAVLGSAPGSGASPPALVAESAGLAITALSWQGADTVRLTLDPKLSPHSQLYQATTLLVHLEAK